LTTPLFREQRCWDIGQPDGLVHVFERALVSRFEAEEELPEADAS
jgi:hypothetical protein